MTLVRPPSRKAFTLLELVVVIVILAILAAIAIVSFRAVIQRTRDKSAETSLAAVNREVAALAAVRGDGLFTQADITEAAADLPSALGAGTAAATQLTFAGTTGAQVTGKVVSWALSLDKTKLGLSIDIDATAGGRSCYALGTTSNQVTTWCADYGAIGADADVALQGKSVVSPNASNPDTPSVPSGITATAGNAQVALAWSAAAGAASYQVFRGGTQVGGVITGTTFTDTGLTNGTSYSYTVKGVNDDLVSAASSAASATPVTVPAAPTGVTATPGNGTISVSWSAVASTAGAPVDGYRIYAGGTQKAQVTGATTGTATGLSVGTSYAITVTAYGAGGEGPASSAANATTWAVPGAPTGVSATAGDASASVSFTPPGSNGGSAITAYKVYANGSATAAATGTSSPISVTGLANGTAYTFVVKATNVVGEGTGSSASSAVTPAASGPSGQVYSWGYNNYGQLGNSSTATSNVPVAVYTSGALSGKTVTNVASGVDTNHSCAVASGGAYCWGINTNGQLGNNTTGGANTTPQAVDTSGVLNGKTVTQVTVGANHSCALTTEGKAYCWGLNTSGQLGVNSTTNSSTPVAVYTGGALNGKTVTQLAAGYQHTCALTSDGLVYCWGYNYYGMLGNATYLGTNTSTTTPQPVYTGSGLSGKTVTQLTTGELHTCALTSDGVVFCWGYNYFGQLGNSTYNGTDNPTYMPAAVVTGGLSGKAVTQIEAGYHHTCAVAAGAAYCWGYNPYGNLGNGTSGTTVNYAPVAVTTSGVLNGKTVTQVSAGGYTTCALTADGKVYCWGEGSNGSMGNAASTGTNSVPVAVYTGGLLNGKTVSQVAGGDLWFLVIAS